MFRMRIFTVHTRPDSAGDTDNTEFVEEGFSFFGFIFGPLWALYHRLWIPAILLFAIAAGLGYTQTHHILTEEEASLIQFGIMLLIGYMGFDWIRARYARKGYTLADITSGTSKLAAQQRYFDRVLPH